MINIKYYLIHCEEHKEREQYLDTIQNFLGKPVEIFKGVYSKDVVLEKNIVTEYINHITDNKVITNYNPAYSGEIGCYLSHFKIIDKIMNDNNNLFINDYSVIFEDDVEFKKDLHFQIQQIIDNLSIQNVDFDVIFLGNLNNNKGKHIVSNVFYLNPAQECWGTHALLFKNKNIKKIYDSILNFNYPIDIQYKICADNNEITALVAYPSICIQKDTNSTIRNNKTNINKVIHNVTNVLLQKKQEIQMKKIMQLRQQMQMKKTMQMKKIMQMKKAKRMKRLFTTKFGYI